MIKIPTYDIPVYFTIEDVMLSNDIVLPFKEVILPLIKDGKNKNFMLGNVNITIIQLEEFTEDTYDYTYSSVKMSYIINSDEKQEVRVKNVTPVDLKIKIMLPINVAIFKHLLKD